MANSPMPHEAGTVIGEKYRIEGRLGVGGMATVYLGVDLETDTQVAIKLLKQEMIDNDPKIVQRFKREGEALRQLNHPNIVKMLATIKQDDRDYVVMEYVSGGDLRDMIDDHRRRSEMIPIERVLRIALDIADALTRAHHLKIIHRDIKPDNVLITKDGLPRLTDFGVARMGELSRVTGTGAIIGTLSYLSPEMCLGDQSDHRADIWSFGVMIYEMLTLRLPFLEVNPAGLLTAIISKEPDSLAELRPDTPPALVQLVEHMMTKDYEQRIGSARRVAAHLEAVISGEDAPQFADTDTQMRMADMQQAVQDYEAHRTTPVSPIAPTSAQRTPTTEPRPITRPDWTQSTIRKISHDAPRIFISYRRADSSAIVGRLYDRLSATFGKVNVFKDVDDIPLGANFRQVLNQEVSHCDVLLVMIGQEWHNHDAITGQSRLFDPDDFVRIEVESGLARDNLMVIPVLVNETVMPTRDELPPSLDDLCDLNAAILRNDPDFNRDSEWLIEQIQNSFTVEKVQKRRISPMMIGTGVLLLIALIAGLIFALNDSGGDDSDDNNTVVENPNAIVILDRATEGVNEGDYWILVAGLEAVDNPTRTDPTRFIVEDLERIYEEEIPLSPIRISAYPNVITSAEQAQAIADANGAELILWGRYTDDNSRVNVQLGNLDDFETLYFDRAPLEEIINITVRMTDEETQSLAVQALVGYYVTNLADGDMYAIALNVLMLNHVDNVPQPDYIGTGIPSLWNQMTVTYLFDIDTSLTRLDEMISRSPRNALIYMQRTASRQQINDERWRDDLQTAQVTGAEGWASPLGLQVTHTMFVDNNPAGAIESLTQLVELRPNDSYLWTLKGIAEYVTGDIEASRESSEHILALTPQVNFAYFVPMGLALRDARLSDAQTIANTVLEDFPNPEIVTETLYSAYGTESPFGGAVEAFGYFTLRQWGQAIESIDSVDEAFGDLFFIILPDLLVLDGIAHCNLGNGVDALESYTRLLDIDPDYYLVYALRASVQENLVDANADLQVALASPIGDILQPHVPAFIAGEITCTNLLDYDFSLPDGTEEGD